MIGRLGAKSRILLFTISLVLAFTSCSGREQSAVAQTSYVGSGAPYVATQLAPPTTGGIVALDYLLQRLSEHRRVLVIGAHPDDEDTAFLTLVARGYGADAAYLSLCRGEGGQNLVGDELGVGLGLLRSGELEAARSVDGARQFFTRAYDFGFSKTLEETSELWQPESLLKDVVRVFRRFRPHVVLTIFRGTVRDGHGQHQASGVVAREAFNVAGDPARFPELLEEEGLEPWAPLKLYQSARFDRTSTTLELPIGSVDPRSGYTYQQIAMASRSRHSSQDMGRLQPIGPAATFLHLLVDRTDSSREEDALFRGIPADTSWVSTLADSLRNEITSNTLSTAVEPTAQALVRAEVTAISVEDHQMLAEALGISAGLVIDARAASADVVPGSPVDVVVELHNGGPLEVAVLGVSILTPEGWSIRSRGDGPDHLPSGTLLERRFAVTAGSNVPPTQPYFLERPLNGALYDWSQVPVALRGLPFQPPQMRALVEVRILGATLTLEREVTYRYNDQATGEQRVPVRVVPLIDVKLEPARLVWPADDVGDRLFTVTLVYNGNTRVAGLVGLEADGLDLPDALPFSFSNAGESQVVRLAVRKPADVHQATVEVRAFARTNDGREFDRGVELVSYPHIRPASMVHDAVSDVRIESLRLPSMGRVGYVRGAADRLPEALSQVGLPLEVLDAEALALADLSVFDAIVVGGRAYETDTALVNHNDRLLDYVETGGHLVVLYQQYQFAAGDFAPFDIEIARPHDRITDETAPVTILQPDHAAFTVPNRITEDDWQGWPQERGLYFASTWDEAYTPLLEMADPGSDPVRGGLLVAQYGDGTYVYTGLSFFRAIPAGVVGAYRIFLNLVNLGTEVVP